jgi:hypothetical protein
MRLAFFGASVTAQKEGYCEQLGKLMKTDFFQMGYGSQHLCDAGICRLSEVMAMRPELCVIDWFSTGYDEISENTKIYIDTIIHGLSSINCKFFFIILPKEEHKERKDFYDFVKAHLKERNTFCADVTEYVDFSSQVCRDSVHTTPIGAKLYSRIIHREYNKFKDKLEINNMIGPTEYSNIQKISVKKKFRRHILFDGHGKIVTFVLTLGKGNGFIKIGDKKIQTWDRWCHYERLNCKINGISIDGETKLEILDEKFDYSDCTDKSVDFDKIKKWLRVEEIFYVGEDLKILNGC